MGYLHKVHRPPLSKGVFGIISCPRISCNQTRTIKIGLDRGLRGMGPHLSLCVFVGHDMLNYLLAA